MIDVFLVTAGTYSDYRVCAVFDTKKLAEKYIKSFNIIDSEFNIEVYPLNPYSSELRSDYKPYFLRMEKEGKLIEIDLSDSSHGFESDFMNYNFDIHMNMYIHVYAKDETHAVKIANEKRLQLLATNRWKR